MKDFFNLSSGEIINIMAVTVAVILAIAGILLAIGWIVASAIAIGTSIAVLVIGMIAAQKAREKQKFPPTNPKIIPPLLPYLPNLTVQEEALDKAIQNWNYPKISKTHKHYPFFCLMCGDINKDAAGSVMERFKKYFSFKLNPKKIYGSIEEKYLDSDDDIKEIPLNTVNFHKAANLNLHDEMWKRLKYGELAAYSGTDWKIRLAEGLAGENRPIFVSATIETANWQRNNIDKFIKEFIAFWYNDEKDWSKIVTQKKLFFEHPLVVCLFFHCDKAATHRRKWFKKQAVPLALQELSSYEFGQRYGAHGVILPTILNIDKNDVLAWAKNYKQTICQCGINIETVKDEIDKLYKKPTDTFPMKILGDKLREILETA